MGQSKHRGLIWLSVIKYRLNEQVLETGPKPVLIKFKAAIYMKITIASVLVC